PAKGLSARKASDMQSVRGVVRHAACVLQARGLNVNGAATVRAFLAMSREESDQEMNRSHIARLITAGALVASVGGAVAPRVASAATLASATYQDEPSDDMGIEQFNAPSAPGVTAGAAS